jgi:hypothetical protein
MLGSIKIKTLFFVLLVPLLSWTQNVRFEAVSDARQVVLGGTFQVEFTIYNGNGTNFTPPPFRNFEILSGPNESSRVSIINGKSSQSYGLSYVLQPKRVGKFTIGPATVQVDGKTLRSSPLSLEVVKGRNSKATTKEELDEELSDGVFIKAIINKGMSKIGEQTVIDYKLFTSRNIESYNVVQESEYPSFFAHEVRRFNSRQIQEVINGVQYTTKVIKRVALFPQQAGIFSIDPLVMNISVTMGETHRRSIFSMPKVTTFSIETDPMEIKVEPLPKAPPTFSGAVGNFQMRTTVNREKLTTDDAISLRMYINGNGDIKQVQAPPLEIPDNFEIYDPKELEESNYEENSELAGKKVFEYLILPNEPGDYNLEAAFTYYDPDSAAYITLRSQSFPIKVSKGTLGRQQRSAEITDPETKADIRFIKTEVNLDNNPFTFLGSGLFWSLFALPFLLLGGVFVLQRIEAQKANIDPILLKRNHAVKIAQKRLEQAQQFMQAGDSKHFYDEVSRASFGYICDKLNIPFSELSKQNVRSKLHSLQVDDTRIEKFMSVVKTCEMALFAGKDNAEAMQSTYDQALEVIVEIEEQVGT